MTAQNPKLKHRVALLLFPAVFAGLSAGLLFALDADSQRGSATLSNAAVNSNLATSGARPAADPEPEEHGLTQEAVEIARLFSLPITNSMVVTWITALGLIVFAKVATRNMKPVPEGAQNLCEWLVEGLRTFLEVSCCRCPLARACWDAS
jgi:F-type H+-transporting ATPase subunit a